MKINNILILAGGDSGRFWPLEEKTFINFLNKPLIKWLVEEIRSYGKRIVIIVHSSLKQKAKEIFRDQVEIVVQKKELLGMAGAILSTTSLSGSTLIVNGSDWLNFKKINDIFKIKSNFDLLITAKKFDNYFPGGYLKFDSKKQLEEIIEKPVSGKEPSKLVKLVVDFFPKIEVFLDQLKKTNLNQDNAYEQAISLLIKKEKKIKVLEYNDYFHPLKYPWQTLPLMNWFLRTIKNKKISSSAKISSKAVINGPVIIEKDSVVGDFAKIVGPTYIGQRTRIADHTLVYQSHIGNNCLIGGYSEVTRSYLSDEVSLHRSYVGDSVIDRSVMMGANTCLANLRFDGAKIKKTEMFKLGAIIGEKAKLGSGVVVLPGIKIGQKTFIGPGEIIRKDLDNNLFFYKGKIKKNIL